MTDSTRIDRAAIEAAYPLIQPHIRKTPVIHVDAADLGLDAELPPIALKLEQLQHAGSFKARGALLNVLGRDIPAAGVTGASGGNHGAALAYAARRAGVPATIFVFAHTPAAKADRIRGYGASVHALSPNFDELMAATHRYAEETGARVIHAYDDPGTLIGQGTTALEFMAQAPCDTYLVATGGGGLIGGMAAYIEHDARLVSVEPETAATLKEALAAGHPVDVAPSGIAADSLGPQSVGRHMFPIAQRYIDAALTVPDSAIRDAQRMLWDRLRLVVEPGGATALAALLSGAYTPVSGERVGVLLCGANTDMVRIPDDAA